MLSLLVVFFIVAIGSVVSNWSWYGSKLQYIHNDVTVLCQVLCTCIPVNGLDNYNNNSIQ